MSDALRSFIVHSSILVSSVVLSYPSRLLSGLLYLADIHLGLHPHGAPYASYTQARRMFRKPLANGLRTKCMYVDGTANLRCAISKRFAYHSPWTETCRIFAQTQRELDAPGVLSTHRVSFARLRFVEN